MVRDAGFNQVWQYTEYRDVPGNGPWMLKMAKNANLQLLSQAVCGRTGYQLGAAAILHETQIAHTSQTDSRHNSVGPPRLVRSHQLTRA